MQAIEIQTNISKDGHISLPPPLQRVYGRQARLILLFDEQLPAVTEESPTAHGKTSCKHESFHEYADTDPPAQEQAQMQEWQWQPKPEQTETKAVYQAHLIQKITQAFPKVLAIYAFGSRVNTTFRKESDLDLAILVEGYADQITLWALASELTEIVNCQVDLLDLRAASTAIQFQVVTTGQKVWYLDPQAGLFECFVLSEKSALDEADADLSADLQ